MTPARKLQLKKRHPATVEKLLQEIQDNMLAKAKTILEDKTTSVQNYDEFKKVLEEKGGFIKAVVRKPRMRSKNKRRNRRNHPSRPFQKEEPTTNCIICEEKAKETPYFARSY